MSDRLYTTTKFKTDTGTISIFDLCCLCHKVEDAADWWSIPKYEIEEINKGNILFVGLGGDGVYKCKIYRDDKHTPTGKNEIIAILRTKIGSFYIGSGENAPGDELGPATIYGGALVAMPAGTWLVSVSMETYDTIVIRFSPAVGDAKNEFTDSPRLSR